MIMASRKSGFKSRAGYDGAWTVYDFEKWAEFESNLPMWEGGARLVVIHSTATVSADNSGCLG